MIKDRIQEPSESSTISFLSHDEKIKEMSSLPLTLETYLSLSLT